LHGLSTRRGNSSPDEVIEATQAKFEKVFFLQKVLDRIAGPTLYKEGCAIM
jgi:hypothetical protein